MIIGSDLSTLSAPPADPWAEFDVIHKTENEHHEITTDYHPDHNPFGHKEDPHGG